MQVLGINDVGKDLEYRWPTNTETYEHYVDYAARSSDRDHVVRVAVGWREVYGENRARVIVFVDGHPEAEFFGADDFSVSGEVLSEIKVPGDKGERLCRYPDEPVPERYMMFNVVGLPMRASGKGLHKGWGVVSSISDHKTMIALAALRKLERAK